MSSRIGLNEDVHLLFGTWFKSNLEYTENYLEWTNLNDLKPCLKESVFFVHFKCKNYINIYG